MASFPLVSATGMLRSAFLPDSLDKAISLGARMIGCDAGSTDPGPGPLATGTCMFSAAAVKRDTEIMMSRAIKAGIPLIGRLGRYLGIGCGPPLQARGHSFRIIVGGRAAAPGGSWLFLITDFINITCTVTVRLRPRD